MKHSIVFSALLSSFLVSSPVLAESPNWNFVELGYTQVDIDDTDFEPAGFAVEGATLVGEDVIFAASYSRLNDDLGSIDVDFNQLSLGLGYRFGYSDTTDIYGIFSYENVEAEASFRGFSEDEDEGGLGLELGFRSMLTDNFELNGSVKYVDIAVDNETTFGVGGYYYVTDSLALGVGYAVSSDANTYGASLRYSF